MPVGCNGQTKCIYTETTNAQTFLYDQEVTCMQVSILCMDNGIQSDSIVTTQHSNAWLCEHACIYAIGVQTVKVNSMLAQTI